MGQKANPNLLRLNKTNQHWNSSWYSDSDYATQFLQDLQIHTYIKNCNQQLKKIPPILFVKRQRGDLQIALLSTKSAQGIARMGNRYHKLRAASHPFGRAKKFPFHSSTSATLISTPFLPLPQFSLYTQHAKQLNSNLSHTVKPKTLSLIPNASLILSFFTDMRSDARVSEALEMRSVAFSPTNKKSRDLPNLPAQTTPHPNASLTHDKKAGIDAIAPVSPVTRYKSYQLPKVDNSLAAQKQPLRYNKFSHAFLSFLFTGQLGLIPATPQSTLPVLCNQRREGANWAPPLNPYGEICACANSPQKKVQALRLFLSLSLTPTALSEGVINAVARGGRVNVIAPTTASPKVASNWSAGRKNNAPFRMGRGKLSILMPLKNHMECSLYSGTQLRSKIHLLRCPSIHQNPFFLAGQIVFLLQERVAFRRLKHRIIEEIRKDGNIKGVRIICSGRVAARSKKAQKARTDSIQWGGTSVNIFSEYVAFASCYAQTAFGKVGVKVWICYEKKNITTNAPLRTKERTYRAKGTAAT